MKRTISIAFRGTLALIGLTVILGCGDGRGSGSVPNADEANPQPVIAASSVSALVAAAPTSVPPTSPPANDRPVINGTPAAGANVSQQRVVLKNAALTMTVDDPGKTIAQVTQMAEAVGGWVVTSNMSATTRNGAPIMQGTISIRIPADQFSTALEQIKAAAISIESEVITGDDVTDKYVDLNSQLANLENTEAQLQKIEASATNINDVLTVQAKLTDVEGQIETIKGQLNYYSQAAAYSLIALTLNPKPISATMTPTITPSPTVKPFGLADWHPEGVVFDAVDTLVSVVQILILVLIWVIVVGVPIAIVVLICWLIWRRFVPKKALLASTTPSATPPTE